MSAVLLKLEQYFEALAAYDRAIAINPDNPKSWFARGYVLQLKKHLESVAAFERAVELDPILEFEKIDLWYGLASTLAKSQKYTEALALIDRFNSKQRRIINNSPPQSLMQSNYVNSNP